MKIKHLILAVCGAMIITSCLTPKTVAYFPELADGASLEMTYTKGILLKPTDKLSIVVNTKSAELNNVLNLPVTSQIIGYSELQSTNQSRGTSGYTIDPEGYIDFPLIGKVKAAGLTRAELAEHLKRTMEEKSVAKDAVVTIEYLNLGFSVIGEVKEPGFYEIKSDRTTLMQALSRAGDMTIYGDRNKVNTRLHHPAERCGIRAAQQLPQASVGQRQRHLERFVLGLGSLSADNDCRAIV